MVIFQLLNMKILHTSDWHLGKHLNNYSRLQEQEEVLLEICDIAEREKVSAVLVAGDLFDTFNPPVEAVELFYKTLKKLSANGTRAVIAIAGNHDSPNRIEAPDPLARECGIVLTGYPSSVVPCFSIESGIEVGQSSEGFLSLKLPGETTALRIITAPYANEYRLRTFLGIENPEAELRSLLKEKWKQIADAYCDSNGINIMVSHLLFINKGDNIPEEPEDEKSILHVGGAQIIYTEDIPGQMQYVALGHLHRFQMVNKSAAPVVYSGSPLAYSFSEANQKKFVQLVEVYPKQPAKFTPIELTKGKRLLRKRAEGIEEAIGWLCENQDALVELTMVTETFLTADDRKKLLTAHSGIVSIIPEIRNLEITDNGNGNIDITKDMESLFIDYFTHSKCQAPGNELISLFKEVLSEPD